MTEIDETRTPTFQEELIEVIKEKPGVGTAALQKHFAPRSKGTVATTLARLRRAGILEDKGVYGQVSSQWFFVDKEKINPLFFVIAQTLLDELQAMMHEGRNTVLARRLQEEFEKLSVTELVKMFGDPTSGQESVVTQVLDYIRENPGQSGAQLRHEFSPLHSANILVHILKQLEKIKFIENRGRDDQYALWYPVEIEEATPEFVDASHWLITGMRGLPTDEKEKFLALYLQQNFQ